MSTQACDRHFHSLSFLSLTFPARIARMLDTSNLGIDTLRERNDNAIMSLVACRKLCKEDIRRTGRPICQGFSSVHSWRILPEASFLRILCICNPCHPGCGEAASLAYILGTALSTTHLPLSVCLITVTDIWQPAGRACTGCSVPTAIESSSQKPLVLMGSHSRHTALFPRWPCFLHMASLSWSKCSSESVRLHTP